MVPIIQNKVRKIGLKHSSLSGSFFSAKTNKEVQFESSLERDFIFLLEMDWIIESYHEQPVTIYYSDSEGKQRSYTPDFLFYWHYRFASKGAKPLLVEIKYKEDIEKNSATYQPKFKAAEEFCEKNGYEFKVLTEYDIRTEYLENCKFLYRYKKNTFDHQHPDIQLILKNMCDLQCTTPRELIQVCARDKYKQMELIYYMWYMVAINIIRCVWEQPLTMDSAIWLDELYENSYPK